MTVEWFAPALRALSCGCLAARFGGLELATEDLFGGPRRARAGRLCRLDPALFRRGRGTSRARPFQRDDVRLISTPFMTRSNSRSPDQRWIPSGLGLLGSRWDHTSHFFVRQETRGSRHSFQSLDPYRNSRNRNFPVLVLGGKRRVSRCSAEGVPGEASASHTPCGTHVYPHASHNFDLTTWEDATRTGPFLKFLKKRQPRRTSKQHGSKARTKRHHPLTSADSGLTSQKPKDRQKGTRFFSQMGVR